MPARSNAVASLAAIVAAVTPVAAQQLDHVGHETAGLSRTLPTQPGDSAFAAIAEIVALLTADPDTDWSRVDIGALRSHLVDMNQLVIASRVQTKPLPNGVRMRIENTGPGGAAASRMVPAHGPVLAAETGWFSDVSIDEDHIVWTVIGDGDEAVRQIQALGFFGLIATGDHHRAHHLALARGDVTH